MSWLGFGCPEAVRCANNRTAETFVRLHLPAHEYLLIVHSLMELVFSANARTDTIPTL